MHPIIIFRSKRPGRICFQVFYVIIEQKFSIIDDALKDIHTTATKEDSLDSIKKGLHSLRKEIRESFQICIFFCFFGTV